MTDDWLDSWTKTRKLPETFRAAGRWATRKGRADDEVRKPAYTPPTIIPYAESMYILRHGKKAYRAWKALQLARSEMPLSVPVEYRDPKAQEAFEAVYRDRLYMLREPR